MCKLSVQHPVFKVGETGEQRSLFLVACVGFSSVSVIDSPSPVPGGSLRFVKMIFCVNTEQFVTGPTRVNHSGRVGYSLSSSRLLINLND